MPQCMNLPQGASRHQPGRASFSAGVGINHSGSGIAWESDVWYTGTVA